MRVCVVARTALVCALLVAEVTVAQEVPTPPLAEITVPAEPFALWEEDSKKKVVAALSYRCMLVSVMQFASYQGNKEAASELVQAMSDWCVIKQMPDDWPDRTKWLKDRDSHLEIAGKLDSALHFQSH